MEVLCIESTKRLIKGEKYIVDNIYNDYGRVTIILSDFTNYYLANRFTKLDGSEITKDDVYSHYKYISFDEVKIGDNLMCLTNRFKKLKKGNYYKVIDKKYDRFYAEMIKFENMKTFVVYGCRLFTILPLSEMRNIKINSLLNDPPNLIDDECDLLIKSICRSVNDPYRHSLSIINWAVDKYNNGKFTNIDYDNILDMTLKDVINKIDN